MEVRLTPGQAPALIDPDDLRRFSVVAAATPDALPDFIETCRGVLDFDGEGHAWVSVAWLIDASSRKDSQEWMKGFAGMQAYAAKQGWTRDEPPAIRGHIVWQE